MANYRRMLVISVLLLITGCHDKDICYKACDDAGTACIEAANDTNATCRWDCYDTVGDDAYCNAMCDATLEAELDECSDTAEACFAQCDQQYPD